MQFSFKWREDGSPMLEIMVISTFGSCIIGLEIDF